MATETTEKPARTDAQHMVIRLPAALHRELKAEAAKQERSMNWLIVHAVAQSLDRQAAA